jgi:hypothetical protein
MIIPNESADGREAGPLGTEKLAMFFRVSLLVVLAALAGGCPDARGPGPDGEHFVEPGRVGADRHSFSMIPPEGFSQAKAGPFHFMSFLGPPGNGFTPNINVTARGDGGLEFDDALPRIQKALVWLLKDYQTVEERVAMLDGRRCYRISGTFDWKGVEVRNLQYFIPGDDDNVFVVTYAAEVARYDEMLAGFEASALTVRVGPSDRPEPRPGTGAAGDHEAVSGNAVGEAR